MIDVFLFSPGHLARVLFHFEALSVTSPQQPDASGPVAERLKIAVQQDPKQDDYRDNWYEDRKADNQGPNHVVGFHFQCLP
jgi:hypothetical protein